MEKLNECIGVTVISPEASLLMGCLRKLLTVVLVLFLAYLQMMNLQVSMTMHDPLLSLYMLLPQITHQV